MNPLPNVFSLRNRMPFSWHMKKNSRIETAGHVSVHDSQKPFHMSSQKLFFSVCGRRISNKAGVHNFSSFTRSVLQTCITNTLKNEISQGIWVMIVIFYSKIVSQHKEKKENIVLFFYPLPNNSMLLLVIHVSNMDSESSKNCSHVLHSTDINKLRNSYWWRDHNSRQHTK